MIERDFDGSHSVQPPLPAQTPKLAEALAKAQGAIPAPMKNRTVDFTDNQGKRVHYNYADLADVIDCIRKPLSENGLSIIHVLEYGSRSYGLVTTLLHSSGESISTWYPLPDPALPGMKPQAFGSAITYARRYSLSALVGIASEEDDDGADAPPAGPAAKPDPVIQPRTDAAPAAEPPRPDSEPSRGQIKRLFTIADERGWTEEQLRGYMAMRWAIDSTKMLTRPQYDSLIVTLETLSYQQACVAFGTGQGGT